MYAEILSIMAPVFLCALLGYGWVRSGRRFDNQLISSLVMAIGAPCLIVRTLGQVDLPQESFNQILLVSVLVTLVTALLSVLVCRLTGVPVRTFFLALTFPNTGNMGLPLSLFAFGEAGLAVALGLFLVISVLHFSVGVAVVSGRASLGQLLRTPILYASLIAVLQVYTGVQLPRWLQNTIDLLGGMSIPLMLLALGVSLAQLRVRDMRLSFLLALCRLGVGFASGVLVAEWLSLQGVIRAVVILQASMPAAVFNYLLADRYQRSPEAVAGVVVMSTLISIGFIPLLLWWLL